MRFLGKILHPKDLTTKEYVDTADIELDEKKVDKESIQEYTVDEVNNLWLSAFKNASVEDLPTGDIPSEPAVYQVKISEDNVSIIPIPGSAVSSRMIVYQNGLLLSEGLHYSIDSDNNIVLIDYIANTNDIFVFINL